MIRLTDSVLDECRSEVILALEARSLNGKFVFEKRCPADDRKATVYFTAEAWAKMVMLIKNFDKEVAWHGVAHRSSNEEENGYYITDIVVYPQEVSGASVDMDVEKYAVWLMENDEDERFKSIFMQGHSHVNFSVSPSGVDMTHQKEILDMLDDDDFYIFMIWNKSFASNCRIYDLKKNALFEDGDVTIMLAGQTESLQEFLNHAKEMVKDKNRGGYVTPTYHGYQGGDQDDEKPPFGGVSAKPYDPVAKKNEKPRTKYDSGESGQLCLPDTTDMYGEENIFAT